MIHKFSKARKLPKHVRKGLLKDVCDGHKVPGDRYPGILCTRTTARVYRRPVRFLKGQKTPPALEVFEGYDDKPTAEPADTVMAFVQANGGPDHARKKLLADIVENGGPLEGIMTI